MSTLSSRDNKEKLSTSIRSERASDFCHDRKSAFTWSADSLDKLVSKFIQITKTSQQ